MRNISFIKLCLLASVLVLSCGLAAAQTTEFNDKNTSPDSATPAAESDSRFRFPVLGFTPWSAPYNLGSPINTPAFDGFPYITEDGLDLFFGSNREVGSGPGDIYVSHRPTRDWFWGDPISLGPDINMPSADDACPMLVGQYLFFNSNRPGGCGNHDIYVSQQLDDSLTRWSAPQNLGCQVNSPAVDGGASLFEDENGTLYLYFHSNRTGGLGLADIYVSQLRDDGTFGPASPVSSLNTPFLDIRAKIRRNGLEIFFESDRPGSIGGSADIYRATRASTTSPWSTPVNLGPTVNSSFIEGGPALSFDGTELYFMSNRPGTFGGQDIFVSTRRKLTDCLLCRK